MTREDYIKAMAKPVEFKPYSKPVFECPLCGKNSVCKGLNQSVCLTTYPPIHKDRYECLEEYGGCGDYVEML